MLLSSSLRSLSTLRTLYFQAGSRHQQQYKNSITKSDKWHPHVGWRLQIFHPGPAWLLNCSFWHCLWINLLVSQDLHSFGSHPICQTGSLKEQEYCAAFHRVQSSAPSFFSQITCSCIFRLSQTTWAMLLPSMSQFLQLSEEVLSLECNPVLALVSRNFGLGSNPLFRISLVPLATNHRSHFTPIL